MSAVQGLKPEVFWKNPECLFVSLLKIRHFAGFSLIVLLNVYWNSLFFLTSQPMRNCDLPHGPRNTGTLRSSCSVSEPKNEIFMWKEDLSLIHFMLEQIRLHVCDVEIVCWPEVVVSHTITCLSIPGTFSEFFKETTAARARPLSRNSSVSWQSAVLSCPLIGAVNGQALPVILWKLWCLFSVMSFNLKYTLGWLMVFSS